MQPGEPEYVVKLKEGWWLMQIASGNSTMWVNIHELHKAMRMSYAEARIRADKYNQDYCTPQAFVERWTPLGQAA